MNQNNMIDLSNLKFVWLLFKNFFNLKYLFNRWLRRNVKVAVYGDSGVGKISYGEREKKAMFDDLVSHITDLVNAK